MKLTKQLALSQLKVNKRRTLWTFWGIALSTAMLTTIYNLGYGSGMNWVDRITLGNEMRLQYLAVVSGIAIIMSSFVIAISIIVISNAFRVSATERLAQFGILKSTGATKKQIIETVIFEGLFLTVLAVPLGLIIGLLFQWISVLVINQTIGPMLNVDRFSIEQGFDDYLFRFILSPIGMMLSLSVSTLTVFISAYLPAKKAARVSAINAIRGTGEIKIKKKKIKHNLLLMCLFKTEGMLARTFLKRSKKNFRATVIAMTFSIAIFIIAGSIYTQVSTFATMNWETVGADLIFRASKPWFETVDCEVFDTQDLDGWESWDIDHEGNETRVCNHRLDTSERSIEQNTFTQIHDMISSLLDSEEKVMSIARTASENYIVQLPIKYATSELLNLRTRNGAVLHTSEHIDLHLNLTVVDPEFHAQLASLAGVEPNSTILINHGREWDDDNRLTDLTMLADLPTSLEIYQWNEDWSQLNPNGKTIYVDGMISGSNRPLVLSSGNGWSMTVIVPLDEGNRLLDLEWYVNTDSPNERFNEIQDIIFNHFADDAMDVFTTNFHELASHERNTIGLILFFLASFVGVLILISLTNIISTISENVKTRSKEFAVLQSVGMTSSGIKRMLNLESIFASMQAIIFGVPLGIVGSYGIFIAMTNLQHATFPVPYLWISISIVAVFFITWVTMQFAAHKLKDQNIIETIRNGSGM